MFSRFSCTTVREFPRKSCSSCLNSVHRVYSFPSVQRRDAGASSSAQVHRVGRLGTVRPVASARISGSGLTASDQWKRRGRNRNPAPSRKVEQETDLAGAELTDWRVYTNTALHRVKRTCTRSDVRNSRVSRSVMKIGRRGSRGNFIFRPR